MRWWWLAEVGNLRSWVCDKWRGGWIDRYEAVNQSKAMAASLLVDVHQNVGVLIAKGGGVVL